MKTGEKRKLEEFHLFYSAAVQGADYIIYTYIYICTYVPNYFGNFYLFIYFLACGGNQAILKREVVQFLA